MDISPQLLGSIAGLVALLSIVPYIVSILRGYTKPSRSAYAIWVVIEILTAASYIAAGARATMWVSLAISLSAIVIFFLSFKYGMGGASKLDLWCLGLAAAAIICWLTTKNPVIALCMGVLAGKIGYVPVIKKSYLYPETENNLSWIMIALASFLNICALTSLKFEIAIVPIASFGVQAVVVFLLVFPRQRLVWTSNP